MNVSLKKKNAHTIIKAIENSGFEARLVGGCVRDEHLSVDPKDFDIATTSTPEKTLHILESHGIKAVKTGIDFGTVTAVTKFGQYEITTLRSDINTNGRQAEVAFGVDFKKDAERRDFTINALSQDLSGKVYDYFGGIEDLKNRLLKFVGNPSERIKEDYLRILRLYKFWARYDLTVDCDTLKAVSSNLEGLKIISKERIASELEEILNSKNEAALTDMHERGVFQCCSNLLKNQTFKPSKGFGIQSEAYLGQYLQLLENPLSREEVINLVRELKLSNAEKIQMLNVSELANFLREPPSKHPQADAIIMAEKLSQTPKGLEKLGRFFIPSIMMLGPALFSDKRLQNRLSFFRQVIESKSYLIHSKLPLKTDEVMNKFNLTPGKELGEKLKELRLEYLESN